MKYIVIEIQKTDTGSVSTIATTFDSSREAESKYHQILMYAAKSELPLHAACMMLENGTSIMHKAYYLGETGTDSEEPLANLSE